MHAQPFCSRLPLAITSIPLPRLLPSHPPIIPRCLQLFASALQVGSRYSLQKVLGYGSYSAVCLAVDRTTGERVGVKGPGFRVG